MYMKVELSGGRKSEVKDNSKVSGLNNWKDGVTKEVEMERQEV